MKTNQLSENEWSRRLTPEQYHVLREKGTEAPFSGEYCDTQARGMYVCAGCGHELFVSDAKYHSKSGWPSFFEPKSDSSIAMASDDSQGMKRTEVLCAACGGHLGHVFDDGPQPTGKRYCINSTSLDLKEET